MTTLRPAPVPLAATLRALADMAGEAARSDDPRAALEDIAAALEALACAVARGRMLETAAGPVLGDEPLLERHR